LAPVDRAGVRIYQIVAPAEKTVFAFFPSESATIKSASVSVVTSLALSDFVLQQFPVHLLPGIDDSLAVRGPCDGVNAGPQCCALAGYVNVPAARSTLAKSAKALSI